MKLTIDRKLLLAALGRISHGVESKPGISGGGVQIIAETKIIQLITDCGDVRMFTEVECDLVTAGTVFVSYASLHNILFRDFEFVEMESNQSALEIRMGTFRVKLPLIVETPPSPRDTNNRIALLSMDGIQLSRAVSTCCSCSGDGKVHAWNDGLHILDDGAELVFETSNGKQVSIVRLPTTDSKFDVLLPSKLVKPLAKDFAASEGMVMVHVFDGRVSFVTDTTTVDIVARSIKCPNMGKMVAATAANCTQTVTVKRDALACAVTTAGAVLTQNDYGIKLTMRPDGIVVAAESVGGNTYSESVPYAGEAPAVPSIDKVMGHWMLLNRLKSLSSDTIDIHYANEWESNGLMITPTDIENDVWMIALIGKA